MKKTILIFLLLLCTTGCFNYQEVNDLAIVSTMAIDYKDNNYEVLLEIQENNKDNKYSSYLLHGKGHTLDFAIQNSISYFNKDLYFVNLDVLLISSSITEDKLLSLVNFIVKDNNYAFNYNIAICDYQEIALENIMNSEEIFGRYVKKLFNKTNSNNINIKINDLLQSYLNKFKDIVLPVFDLEENNIIINRAAIFNDLKIVDYLDKKEIEIYNILNNNFKNYYLNNEDENAKFIFKAIDYKTKIYYRDKTLYLMPNLTGSFIELENNYLIENYKKEQQLNEVNKLFDEQINNFVLKLITNNSDILGFKKIIYNQNLNTDNSLKNLNFEIKTKVKITNNFLTSDNMEED